MRIPEFESADPGILNSPVVMCAHLRARLKYQLLIMFLISGGTGLGTLAAVLGGAYLLTDERHQLRLDRLSPIPAG